VNRDMHSARTSRLRSAALETLPLVGSIVVSFTIVGAAAHAAGFSVLESTAMTALVFAAPAQLVLIGLVKSGVDAVMVGLAVLLINVRLLFMSFGVVTSMRKVPTLRLMVWCALLSGLSFTRFGVLKKQSESAADGEDPEIELAVSCLMLYGCAVAATAFGGALTSLATPVWIDGVSLMVAMVFVGRIAEARSDRMFFWAACICTLLTPLAGAWNKSLGPLLLALALATAASVAPLVRTPQGARLTEQRRSP